jgi:hypothetical protein
MPSVQVLLHALSETTIAQQIGIPHDETRMRFALRNNTVRNFEDFSDIIADYYNYHFTSVVARGGRLSRTEAGGKAKQILEQEYKRFGGDLVSAFNDAHEGTNSGLRGVIDKLAEALKAESVERYTREMFDRHVSPVSWDQKVAIIRSFLDHYGSLLGASVDAAHPERYASNYVELLRNWLTAFRRGSSVFRRL